MNIDLSEYRLVRPDSIEYLEGIEKFYDIEVEDDHTFHIVGENDLITESFKLNVIGLCPFFLFLKDKIIKFLFLIYIASS